MFAEYFVGGVECLRVSDGYHRDVCVYPGCCHSISNVVDGPVAVRAHSLPLVGNSQSMVDGPVAVRAHSPVAELVG